MKKILLLALAIGLVLTGCSRNEKTSGGAALEPFDSHFAAFKASMAGKDYGHALAAVRTMLESFRAASPLLLENVKFVKSGGNSFGIYDPREVDAFAPDEVIYLYMEPAGFAVTREPSGIYGFGFSADFRLEDEKGKVLAGQAGFANLPFKSWNLNTEIALTFNFTFSGLEKGKYKVVTDVHDTHSDKKAAAEKWFSIT